MKLRAALLLLVPVLVVYVYGFVAPLAIVGRLSFYDSDYVRESWAGISNYVDCFKDRLFMKTFRNTLWFVLMIVPLKMLFCYKIASFLTGFSRRVQSVARFLLYVPALTSGLIMTLIWSWFLLREGLFNQVLTSIGLQALPWLYEPWLARASISMIVIVSGVGFYVIVLSASMLSVPKELREVAIVDGATERQYKRHILFPLMVPTILLCLLLLIVGIAQMWETIYVLTGSGGPEYSTSTPVYDVFQTAFRFGHQSFAAAKGIMLMLAIGAVLGAKALLERRLRI